MKTRTKFVIVSIINIIWFSVIVLWLSYNDKTVPDSLIKYWFSAWTIELGLLCGIKIKSRDHHDDDDMSL